MPIRHLAEHGSDPEGDALTCLRAQDRILDDLRHQWRSDIDQWERGTLAKLTLEHAAVREAAIEVIAADLKRHDRADSANQMLELCQRRRRLISGLDRATQGKEPAAIAADGQLEHDVDELLQLADREARTKPIADLEDILGEARAELPSAKKVRRHAPTRLGDHEPRWYDGLSVAARVHAAYDRMRGFPWPESVPLMDEGTAERFDRESSS